MNIRYYTLGCAILIALNIEPASGQPGPSFPAPEVVSVEGSDLHRARKVLKKFYASERHPECYKVLFSTFQGNLRIDFVPKKPDPVRNETDPKQVDPKICGKNVGYVIDKDGNPLRMIYSK